MPERQFDLRFICSRLMASGTRFLLHVVRYLLVLSLDYLFLDCISRLCPRKNCIIFLILPSNEACTTDLRHTPIVDLAIFPRIVTAPFHGTNTKSLLYDLFNTWPVDTHSISECVLFGRKIYPDSFN